MVKAVTSAPSSPPRGQARVDSLKHFFAAVASDLDKPAADADVVRQAWERIAPGEDRGVEGGRRRGRAEGEAGLGAIGPGGISRKERGGEEGGRAVCRSGGGGHNRRERRASQGSGVGAVRWGDGIPLPLMRAGLCWRVSYPEPSPATTQLVPYHPPLCVPSGLTSSYDAPRSLPCIAPRALLVATGGVDARCPLQGVCVECQGEGGDRGSQGGLDAGKVAWGSCAERHTARVVYSRRRG